MRSLTASKPTKTMTQHNDNKTTDDLAVDSASAGSVLDDAFDLADKIGELRHGTPRGGIWDMLYRAQEMALNCGNELRDINAQNV